MSVQSIDSLAPAPVWRLPPRFVLVAVAVGILSLWPFWDGLAMMWGWWIETPEYSHGLLIPPVAIFLIWQQKHRLERIQFRGSWWGVALVLFGGAALLIGQFGTVLTLVQYAYLITLYGLILAFVGWPAFKIVAVPLLILLFMIPLPQFVLANLSVQLQLLSSQIGVMLIRMFDISVFLEGNVIDLGGYKLEVAEACSGLRYLFPLMTLGFLMAYFYKGAFWKRALLFLSSIPITVLMNSARVGLIGISVERWGVQMAEGFLHEFQGWAMFMLSALLMLGEIMLLNRIGREAGTWRQLFGVEFPQASPAGVPTSPRKLPVSFLAAGALLLVFVGVTSLLPRRAETIPARVAFTEFPLQLASWRGHQQLLDGVYSDALKLDDYLLADYVGEHAAVNVYIAYYNSQRKGEAVHSPRSCLPGGGWQLRNFEQRNLPGIEIDGRPLRVNRTLIELGNQRQLVYYWFQQRGRVITNEFAVKWYLFWDALTRNRTDGALVRLIVSVPRDSDEGEADRALTDIASRIAPTLTRYVPD
ncbi:MAG TPA: VPLPA-CTERM-specific exosortase XrtD [Steroidobacteraceae bacterium]|nr:VPLPA-CTERM-specific exosortase XrtD [Steroidobacteraceae bacterium]